MASFSSARTTLYSTAQLVITFSQPILTPFSQCTLTPNYDIFSSASIDTSKTSITLTPYSDILGFTSTMYAVNCTHMLTTGANISISMAWKDSTYTLQSTAASLLLSHAAINTVTTSIVGTLINKNYNSPGYHAEYTISLALATNTSNKIITYIDFYPYHVHSAYLECEYSIAGVWNQVLCIPTFRDTQSEIYI